MLNLPCWWMICNSTIPSSKINECYRVVIHPVQKFRDDSLSCFCFKWFGKLRVEAVQLFDGWNANLAWGYFTNDFFSVGSGLLFSHWSWGFGSIIPRHLSITVPIIRYRDTRVEVNFRLPFFISPTSSNLIKQVDYE